MEFLVTGILFVWGYMLTWPFLLIAYTGSVFVCVDDEPGYFGIIAVGLLSYSTFHMYEIPFSTYKWYLIGYLPAGFLWSLFRFGRYARYVSNNANNGVRVVREDWFDGGKFSNDAEKTQYIRDSLSVENNVEKIVYWITSWPISVISWGIKDVITEIKIFVTEKARKVYESIANKYIQ